MPAIPGTFLPRSGPESWDSIRAHVSRESHLSDTDALIPRGGPDNWPYRAETPAASTFPPDSAARRIDRRAHHFSRPGALDLSTGIARHCLGRFREQPSEAGVLRSCQQGFLYAGDGNSRNSEHVIHAGQQSGIRCAGGLESQRTECRSWGGVRPPRSRRGAARVAALHVSFHVKHRSRAPPAARRREWIRGMAWADDALGLRHPGSPGTRSMEVVSRETTSTADRQFE